MKRFFKFGKVIAANLRKICQRRYPLFFANCNSMYMPRFDRTDRAGRPRPDFGRHANLDDLLPRNEEVLRRWYGAIQAARYGGTGFSSIPLY